MPTRPEETSVYIRSLRLYKLGMRGFASVISDRSWFTPGRTWTGLGRNCTGRYRGVVCRFGRASGRWWRRRRSGRRRERALGWSRRGAYGCDGGLRGYARFHQVKASSAGLRMLTWRRWEEQLQIRPLKKARGLSGLQLGGGATNFHGRSLDSAAVGMTPQRACDSEFSRQSCMAILSPPGIMKMKASAAG
jgi:hypothetical protein